MVFLPAGVLPQVATYGYGRLRLKDAGGGDFSWGFSISLLGVLKNTIFANGFQKGRPCPYKNTNPEVCISRDNGVLRCKSRKKIRTEQEKIREFRNRIAHHEPICFDSSGNISTDFARRHYQLIRDYISYMGQDPDTVIQWAEKPDKILNKIDCIR